MSCEYVDAATQPELLASLHQHPAEFHMWSVIEFIDFVAALITEQIELIVIDPVSEHQRSYARRSVASHWEWGAQCSQ